MRKCTVQNCEENALRDEDQCFYHVAWDAVAECVWEIGWEFIVRIQEPEAAYLG